MTASESAGAIPVQASLPAIHHIAFHDDIIDAFERDGQRFVAMRRIVENLGLNWSGQQKKLAAQKARFDFRLLSTVAEDGKQRKMSCIPCEMLPLWLATINLVKIQDELISSKVELYQKKSAIALFQYWATSNISITADLELVARVARLERLQVANKPRMEKIARSGLSDGGFCVRDAAKILHVQEKLFVAWLVSHSWVYRRLPSEVLQGRAEKERAGFIEHDFFDATRADGSSKRCAQVLITAKGILRLETIMRAAEGLLPPPERHDDDLFK